MQKGLQRMIHDQRVLEINGGSVLEAPVTRLLLRAGLSRYADAQIDDYGQSRKFRNRPGTVLTLQARFSHPADRLQGTAGFGFWNAPFGDPSFRRLALPQAAWFFFASSPGDLPFAPESPGRGWFAGTVDAGNRRGIAMVPLAPAILLLNQFKPLRRLIWPPVQRRLGISFASLDIDLTAWHCYQLQWLTDACRFLVDDRPVLITGQSPRGPLGFVCWLDNQYLVLTSRGRIRSGTLVLPTAQWMEISNLQLRAY
jgi:hypothetical protein